MIDAELNPPSAFHPCRLFEQWKRRIRIIQSRIGLNVDTTPSNSPYPESLPIREAGDHFLAKNHFRVEDCTAPTYTVKLLGLPLEFPNTKAHQWATPLHDLDHVLTGYRTNWIGEAEIGAWELRAGCQTFVVFWLDLAGVAIGLFLRPLRVWRAFRAARGARTLYRDPELCAAIMEMTVGEVRSRLGVPPGGLKAP